MKDSLPSDLIIGALEIFVGCTTCDVKILGADAFRIAVDSVPISTVEVDKKNFSENGISYLHALMKYPAIWKVDSVSAWESLHSSNGFIKDDRIAAIGLFSLTSVSHEIRVTVRQGFANAFIVEKNEMDDYRSFLAAWPADELGSNTVAVDCRLRSTSFTLFPNDFLRLASRLRDFADRNSIAATLQDQRPDSPMFGSIYTFK